MRAIPVNAIVVPFHGHSTLVQQVIEMGDRFAGRHDQVVLGDLGPEQGRKYIDGAFPFGTQCLELVETVGMFFNQGIETVMGAVVLAKKRPPEQPEEEQ